MSEVPLYQPYKSSQVQIEQQKAPIGTCWGLGNRRRAEEGGGEREESPQLPQAATRRVKDSGVGCMG